jgi:hypothetical protein
MYGEKRELVTFQCTLCSAPCPLWIDREDLERARLGTPVPVAFASRSGQSYLTVPDHRLIVTGHCDRCREPQPQLQMQAACARCRKVLATPGICSDCLEVVQLCSAIRDFVTNCAPLLQGLANEARTGLDVTAVLRGDFSNIVLVLGLADGPLSSAELTILGDLWCYLDPAEVTSTNATQCALAIADRFLKSSPKPLPELPSGLSILDIYDRAAGTQHGSTLRSLAFRLADLVAKADGVVTDLELQCLRYYEGILARSAVQVEQVKHQHNRLQWNDNLRPI